MMSQSKSSVSVVIPCYNLGEYLPEAVESVRQQSYPPTEIIVVDDGSTDEETRQVLAHYEQLDPQIITVYHTPNGGAPAARNYGISRAQSEYILCLDADDVLLPTFLEETVAQLDAQPLVGIVATHVEYFGTQVGVWRPQGYTPHSILWRNPIPSCSLFRKSCWQQTGGYKDLKACQDWEFWLSIVEEYGWHWSVVAKPLYRYRQRTGSISEYREAHRPELLHQIVQLHMSVYQQHVAQILVEMDAELLQLRQQNQKHQREKKAQTEAVKTLQKALHDATQRTATGADPTAAKANQDAAHRKLVQRVREAVHTQLPKAATVLVVSQGKSDWLTVGGEQGWHFPQKEDGSYLGHHPMDSAQVIAQLETLQAKGAHYLLIPQSGFWWLERCPAFKHYLESKYPAIIRRDDTCLLFDLCAKVEQHTFSVVIATYNRAAFLTKTFESVFNQNYPKDRYELIVIDNDSADNTAAVVQQAFVGAPIPCSYYVEKQNGLSYARNLGIEKAQFEFIAQLDDDAIANPDWLAAFNRVINEQHALVVGGRVEKSFEEGFTPPDWFNYQYLKHFFGVNYRDRGKKEKVFPIRHPLYLSGGNTAYAKRVIEHFGGFRVDLGRNGKSLLAGEESFLNLVLERNDIPIYYTDDASIHHYVGSERLNKAHLRKKALWSGVTNAYVQPLFFGHEAVLSRTKENWTDLWNKARQILAARSNPENFSRVCRILYHLAFLYTFYMSYLKYRLRGRRRSGAERYTLPQVTWTTAHWIDEVLRWPDKRDKYEQLYQLYLTSGDADKAQAALEKLAAYQPQDGLPSTTSDWERLEGPLRRMQYERLVERIRATVETVVAHNGKVAVISKGDGELLKLNGRQGWHFPQDDQGGYTGYYPVDSSAAIVHLEALRARGAAYLVLPSTALWWLDYYAEFGQYLMQHYQAVVQQKDTCLIFALREPLSEATTGAVYNRHAQSTSSA